MKSRKTISIKRISILFLFAFIIALVIGTLYYRHLKVRCYYESIATDIRFQDLTSEQKAYLYNTLMNVQTIPECMWQKYGIELYLGYYAEQISKWLLICSILVALSIWVAKNFKKIQNIIKSAPVKRIVSIISRRIDWICIILGAGLTVCGILDFMRHSRQQEILIKILFGVMSLVFGVLLYKERQMKR